MYPIAPTPTASELARKCEAKRQEKEAYYQKHKEVIDHFMTLADQEVKLTGLSCKALIEESHAKH